LFFIGLFIHSKPHAISLETITKWYNKLKAPEYRVSFGISSMIGLQIMSKKSIPFIRLLEITKKTHEDKKKKNIKRILHKIKYIRKDCDFFSLAVETFKRYNQAGDIFERRKENLVRRYNELIANEENTINKIKTMLQKKENLKNIFFKKDERAIPRIETDFNTKENGLEDCTIEEYLKECFELIEKEESTFINRIMKCFLFPKEQITFLLILGELQFLWYLLPLIYTELNKTAIN
jgi:hypothetical protein